MADYDITIPDVELPDFEGLQSQLKEIDTLSDMKSFISQQTLQFQKENIEENQVSFDFPKDLIFKYQDKTTFSACEILTESINKKIVNIQVKYLSTKKSIFKQIDKMMEFIDGYYLEPPFNPNIISTIPKNFEMKKLEMIEEIPLPECLKEYKPTSKQELNIDEMISVEIENCSKMLISKNQFNLFKICESIEEILRNGIFEEIQKLKEQIVCVSECCEPHSHYIVNVLSKIVLPYDKFEGNFRVYRLGQYKGEYPIFNTQRGLEFLSRLDYEYRQFFEIIEDCASEIKRNFNQQSKEPFLAYKNF